jgi:hypothetical protein
MSLLDRLLKEVPKRKPASLFNPQREIVRKYMTEITEAKERGYSWTQIRIAVKAEAAERGEWDEERGSLDVEKMYRRLMEEEG